MNRSPASSDTRRRRFIVGCGTSRVIQVGMTRSDDINDAERLSVDPAMRHIVGERAKDKTAASVSQMGQFETEILTQPANLEILINQPG